MALKNLFNRARSFGQSPEGRRLINQAGSAARQRGTRGRSGRVVRPQSGSSGLMGLAQRFLGRGGAGGTRRH